MSSSGRKKNKDVLKAELESVYSFVGVKNLETLKVEIKYLKDVEWKFNELLKLGGRLAQVLKKYDIQDGEATHALAAWKTFKEKR